MVKKVKCRKHEQNLNLLPEQYDTSEQRPNLLINEAIDFTNEFR